MKKCTTYTLGQTTAKKYPDPDPDTSYLGEYGEEFKPGCIVRADRSFYEDHLEDDEYDPPTMSREYSFFYPPDNGEKPGTPEYKKYALQDYELMEGLDNQQWTFVIIRVSTPITTDTGISDVISNTLSGVEDHWDKDSDDGIREVVEDLKSMNRAELVKMGFSEDEINKSFENMKEVD